MSFEATIRKVANQTVAAALDARTDEEKITALNALAGILTMKGLPQDVRVLLKTTSRALRAPVASPSATVNASVKASMARRMGIAPPVTCATVRKANAVSFNTMSADEARNILAKKLANKGR